MDEISNSIDKIIPALKQIEQVLQSSWNIQGWSDVSGIFTAVSAIATMILACLTRKTLTEMKETREEASRPYIVIDFAYKKNHRALYLITRNTGKTIAYNVKLQSEPKILGKSVKGDSTSKIDILIDRFGDCIQSVVPDWEYETFIDKLKEFSEDDNFHVQVAYQDVNGKQYLQSYNLSVRHFKRIMWLESDDDSEKLLKEITVSIKNIDQSLSNLTKINNKS